MKPREFAQMSRGELLKVS